MFTKKHLKYFLIVFVVFLIVFSLFLFKIIKKTKADTAYLYPAACLGNWENISNVQGQPQLLVDSPWVDFNDENSANSNGDNRQIFCSAFSGNISQLSSVKKAVLRIIWSSEPNSFDFNEAPSDNSIPNELSEDIELEKGIELEDNLDTENIPRLEPEEYVETEEAIDEIEKAEVEEVIDEVEKTESVESVQEDTTLIYQPDINLNEVDDISGEVEPVATFLDVSSDNILEEINYVIRYSIDGSSWNVLANVKDVNIDKEFFIPFDNISDLSRVQISIESTKVGKIVYLDGMFLEIEYEKDSSIVVPDFENNEIMSIKSNDGYSVMILRDIKNNINSLWLYNTNDLSWEKISNEESLNASNPVFLDNDYIFWLPDDSRAIIGFNLKSHNYFSGSLDYVDGKFFFDFSDFKIIYDNWQLVKQNKDEDFLLYSDDDKELSNDIKNKFYHSDFFSIEEDNIISNISEDEVIIEATSTLEEIDLVNEIILEESIEDIGGQDLDIRIDN